MPTEPNILINRAPVLTLWAATVAERLGFDEGEALSLGKAVAGLNAQSKGRRLGIFKLMSRIALRITRLVRCAGFFGSSACGGQSQIAYGPCLSVITWAGPLVPGMRQNSSGRPAQAARLPFSRYCWCHSTPECALPKSRPYAEET
jgi:hypothetical protein